MSLKICRAFLSASTLLLILKLSGCGIYSFTGVAITAETLTIETFYNEAEGGPPDLAQTFTNKLRDYYLQNTNLTLVKNDGELQIEGVVTGYKLSPVAPTAAGGNNVGLSDLTRLTITVSATYTNTEDDTFNFENKRFSFYSDFDSNQNLTVIENRLIEEIYDQIILDIFNASVANW
ncbi:LPS assembly lipoprotein LptE [Fulvivirga lutea]|uniref:LPS assembly lipoprotein LptE n=1 Tax=Fulvivirga lutea TaxID=2810512 RepID=UPI001F3987BF|nr:LptE family protein [Fulvivirga lutea]